VQSKLRLKRPLGSWSRDRHSWHGNPSVFSTLQGVKQPGYNHLTTRHNGLPRGVRVSNFEVGGRLPTKR